MKTSDYIVEFLIKNGIKDVFGYPGGMVTHLMDSLDKYTGKIGNHLCYHEQAAAFSACSNAQLSNNIGCAYTTSGPGATNLITGIGHAFFDSIPVLFITGQVNTYELKKNLKVRQRGFQETDIVSIVEPITKYTVLVEKEEDLRYCLEKAVYMAKEGRPGPVLVDIPMNISRAEIDPDRLKSFHVKPKETQVYSHTIFELLARAKRPVIIAGAGIDIANARPEFKTLIKKLKIPVVTSMIAVDVLNKDDEFNYGFIGAYGDRTANFIVSNSDLIIAMGSRLDMRQTGTDVKSFAPNAKIVRVDIDKGELENKIGEDELSLNYDLKPYLNYLNTEKYEIKMYNDWIEVCEEYRKNLSNIDPNLPNEYIETISKMLDDGFEIITDVGQNQVWVAQAFKNVDNQRILFTGGHGCMGYSLPAAIGAYYATHKKVIAFTGDGGLQMNIQELQFLKREHIPVKIIVLNNESLGMIRHFQEMYFDSKFVHTINTGGYLSPDFVKIANAYGITSVNVNQIEQLNELQDLIYNDEPVLINLNLGDRTYLYPKLAVNRPIDDQEPLLDRALYKRLKEL